jgi:antitoxin component YwqK of YwqJK toxin-antitoxin module
MHKLLITLLIITQSIIASSQTIQKKTYYYDRRTVESAYSLDMKTQQKHGLYKEFSPLGGVIVEGSYNQGKKIGKWVYKLPTTLETITIENYNQKGQLHGDFIGVPNGHHDLTPSTGKYINGNKEGTWKEFVTRKGEMYVTSVSHWENGLRTGDYTEYYLNGKVKFQARYEQGQYNDNGIWGALVDTAFYYGEELSEPRLQKIEVYKYNRRIYSEEFKTASDMVKVKEKEILSKYNYVPDSTKIKRKRRSFGDEGTYTAEYEDGDRLIFIDLLCGLANSDGVSDDEAKWLSDFVQNNNKDPKYYTDEVVRYIDIIANKTFPSLDWKQNAVTKVSSEGIFWELKRYLVKLAALDNNITLAEEAFIDKALRVN